MDKQRGLGFVLLTDQEMVLHLGFNWMTEIGYNLDFATF